MAPFLVPDFITSAARGTGVSETMDPRERFPGHAGCSRRIRAALERGSAECEHFIVINNAKLFSTQGFTCTNYVGRIRPEPH